MYKKSIDSVLLINQRDQQITLIGHCSSGFFRIHTAYVKGRATDRAIIDIVFYYWKTCLAVLMVYSIENSFRLKL